MKKFKVTYSSTRILLTAILLFLPFIPLSLANIGQPFHEPTIIEGIENAYGYLLLFPFGFIINYLDIHIIPIVLLAIIIDSYFISLFINNLIDFVRQKFKSQVSSNK